MRSSLLFRMELPRNKSWLFVTLFITGWVFVSLWTCIFVTLSSFLILGWFVGAVSGEHWFCPGELCLYIWLCDIKEYPANWCIEEFDFQFYVSICFPDFLQFPKCFPSFSMLVFKTFIVSFSHAPKYWRQSTTSTFWSMEFRSMELKGFFKSTNTAIKGRSFESHH